jgi:hypothetical protein
MKYPPVATTNLLKPIFRPVAGKPNAGTYPQPKQGLSARKQVLFSEHFPVFQTRKQPVRY